MDDIDKAMTHLTDHKIEVEPIRTDEYIGKRDIFFQDPDKLPLELYEL